MTRLITSKEIVSNLRVGVSGILQFSEKYKQVKIRQPATILGWKPGERFLLDAGTPTYQNSARLHEFLHERCIYRYIVNHCAYALEGRLLDVSVQMGRRSLWIGWPNHVHVYPYRSESRMEVELPCNVQAIGMTGAGEVFHGQILDLSTIGCCLGLPATDVPRIGVGKTLLLSFHVGDLPAPCAVEGRVRHVRDYDSTHICGIEFSAIPEEVTAELHSLLANNPHFPNELEALRSRKSE